MLICRLATLNIVISITKGFMHMGFNEIQCFSLKCGMQLLVWLCKLIVASQLEKWVHVGRCT
jgi:hypothetical protein